MSMQDIAEKIRARVAGGGFARSVKFNCGSDGVVVVNGASVSTEDGEADCTISLSKDDMESLMSGDLNPTMAYMQGKLKIEGDMSVAMSLSQVL